MQIVDLEKLLNSNSILEFPEIEDAILRFGHGDCHDLTLSLNEIYHFIKSPIVWTPMDIEPLTGGCHFNSGCERYRENCGNCPQINNSNPNDISNIIFTTKTISTISI